MKNKAFDDLIRSRMEELSASPQLGNWPLFEARLKDEEDKVEREAEMDELIKQKIALIHPSYTRSSWHILAEKLHKQREVTKKLLFSKIIELAAFILLLFLVFYSIVQSPVPPVQQQTAVIQILPQSEDELTIVAGIKQQHTTKDEPADKRIKVLSPANLNKKQHFSATSFVSVDQQHSLLSDSQERVEVDNTAVSFDDKKGKKQVVTPPFFPDESGIVQALSVPVNQVIPFQNEVYGQPEELEKLAVRTKILHKREHFFTAYSVFDYNFVLTPFDNDFQEEAYIQGASGYGIGASYSNKKGKWEYSTGLSYHQLSYNPRSLIEFFDGSVLEGGYFAEEIRRINLNTVHIPLSMHYYLNDAGGFRFFVSGGVGMRLTLATFFDYKRHFVSAASVNSFASSSVDQMQTNSSRVSVEADNVSRISQRPRSAGLIEGGSFINNYYLTAELGGGMLYSLDSKYSLYLESRYRHGLFSPEIGPNRDRINTFSLQLGLRTSF